MAGLEADTKRTLCIGVDVVLLATVVAAVAVINVFAEPFQRGFFCSDDSIGYPKQETSLPHYVINVLALLPLLPMNILDCLRLSRKRKFNRNRVFPVQRSVYSHYQLSIAFSFGLCTVKFISDVMRFSVGRLSPNFRSACVPDPSRYNCSDGYITADVCTGSTRLERLSFPSDHAATIIYSTVFLMMYIHARLTWDDMLLKPFILFGCGLCGLCACVTRITCYMHHPSDVIVGGLIGMTIALYFVHHCKEQCVPALLLETSSKERQTRGGETVTGSEVGYQATASTTSATSPLLHCASVSREYEPIL